MRDRVRRDDDRHASSAASPPTTQLGVDVVHPLLLTSSIHSNMGMNMSTAALEAKLRKLKDASAEQSALLTHKLAESESQESAESPGEEKSDTVHHHHSSSRNNNNSNHCLLQLSSRLSAVPTLLQSLQQRRLPLNEEEMKQQDHNDHPHHGHGGGSQGSGELPNALTLVTQLEAIRLDELHRTRSQLEALQLEHRRGASARACATLYQDVCVAQDILLRHHHNKNSSSLPLPLQMYTDLERVANTVQYLLQQVDHATAVFHHDPFDSTSNDGNETKNHRTSVSSSSNSNPQEHEEKQELREEEEEKHHRHRGDGVFPFKLPRDTERAQFVLKLAPRIRTLESDLVKCLHKHLQAHFQFIMNQDQHDPPQEPEQDDSNRNHHPKQRQTQANKLRLRPTLRSILGALIRSFMVLGRGRDVERLVSHAVLPMFADVRVGTLDQGGPRGECAGLPLFLDHVVHQLAHTWGPLLQYVMSTLDPNLYSLDLVTCGVWVPFLTALTSDTSLVNAIFSPGIAHAMHANYTALVDHFMCTLAAKLLLPNDDDDKNHDPHDHENENVPANDDDDDDEWEHLYYQPRITSAHVQAVQARIYAHPKTLDFTKQWNLPIYYQLRFGECCTTLNQAILSTMRGGWRHSNNYHHHQHEEVIQNSRPVFELPLFVELYDQLLFLWRPHVLIKSLSHRFLRGAVQLLARTIAFCKDGLEKKVRFGGGGGGGDVTESSSSSSSSSNKSSTQDTTNSDNANNDDSKDSQQQQQSQTSSSSSDRHEWYWCENELDVAAVATELSRLESTIRNDYVQVIVQALTATTTSSTTNNNSSSNNDEHPLPLGQVVADVLHEALAPIAPLVQGAWNETIVHLLTTKCLAPLTAVKGVAATYRMTNRPPPTQASIYVSSIVRPLQEFIVMIPSQPSLSSRWKHLIVATVAERYAVAVEELLTTVQRTEAALSSRRTSHYHRQQQQQLQQTTGSSGMMSDGDKVKLQMHYDCERFVQTVQEVGVDPAAVIGIAKLRSLTEEGRKLVVVVVR